MLRILVTNGSEEFPKRITTANRPLSSMSRDTFARAFNPTAASINLPDVFRLSESIESGL